MTISRQAKHKHATDLARLREVAYNLPLVVGFDEAHRQFTVVHMGAPAEVLFQGRYQVLHAYLSGYSRGHCVDWRE
jgi:hypothetical protein